MGNYRRFFIENKELNVGDVVDVDGQEFNHAVNILRLRAKDTIIVCNDTDSDYTCEIQTISKKFLSVKVLSVEKNNCQPVGHIKLICGYLKGDKTELVVQKCVELGVSEIVLFQSKNSSSFMSEKKLERIKKVIIESCKQCGRSSLVKVSYVDNLKQALLSGNDCDSKIFACEFEIGQRKNLSAFSGTTAIVVGSEGGFTINEATLAHQMGYDLVGLGNRILRAETASIALVTIASRDLNNF